MHLMRATTSWIQSGVMYLLQIHEYQIANQEMRVQMLRRQVPVLEGRKEEIQGELNRLLGMLEAEQKKVNQ